MKMNKYLILVLATVALFAAYRTAFANSQKVDLLWKARALQAIEKMETLGEKIKKEDSQRLRYEILIEFAYSNIIATPEMCVYRNDAVTTYHLIMHFGEDGLLDVLYNFDVKSEKLVTVSIDLLPKNRRVVMYSGEESYFYIFNRTDPNEPMIKFSKTNPFGTTVADY